MLLAMAGIARAQTVEPDQKRPDLPNSASFSIKPYHYITGGQRM
jgi:hypothetical protein